MQPARRSSSTSTSRPGKPGFQAYDPENPPADVAHDDDRPGRDRAVHRAGRDRLHRPRPVPDRDALPARQAWTRGRPQKQFNHKLLDHPRRRVRRRPPDRHARRRSPSRGRERARRAASRSMSNALDHAGHNCNLPTAGRVARDDEGAPDRALRDAALHDRDRLLGRIPGPAVDRQRLPRRLPGDPAHVLVPRRLEAPRRSSSTTT